MAQRFARTETVERKAKKNDTVDIDFEGLCRRRCIRGRQG